MNLQEIATELELTQLTNNMELSPIIPAAGYASDLLSCVMAGASRKSLWVTLQAHNNIVAIASLLDLAAVVITENAQPDQTTIQKANEEGVILLSTPQSTFEIAGKLWEIGLRALHKE